METVNLSVISPDGFYSRVGQLYAIGNNPQTVKLPTTTVKKSTSTVLQNGLLVHENNYHFRYYSTDKGIDSRGGVTVTYRPVVTENGRLEIYVGCSYCSPSDNYNKRIGRLQAAGRSIKHSIPYSSEYLTAENMRILAWQIATARSNEILQRLYDCGKIEAQRFNALIGNLVLVSKKNNRKVVSFEP